MTDAGDDSFAVGADDLGTDIDGDDNEEDAKLDEKVMEGDVVSVNDSLLQTSQDLEAPRKPREEKEIPKNERTTTNRMYGYEYCRLIGARIKQLDDQAIKMTDPSTNQPVKGVWSKEIAENEMKKKVFPILLKRTFPRGSHFVYYEIWDPNEMILPSFNRDDVIDFYS